MNALFVGFARQVPIQRQGCLFLCDDVPDVKRARVFDYRCHSINPLRNISYKKAREIADVLYTISPQGENTLTVRNGRRALLKALLSADRLDRIQSDDEEVRGLIDDILVSPVLRSVLCRPQNFSLNPRSVILARLNRAEIGEFDCLVLGLFLAASFEGTICVPDAGFYLRDAHRSLIRENRLVLGVNHLSELSPKLRAAALLIENKTP